MVTIHHPLLRKEKQKYATDYADYTDWNNINSVNSAGGGTN